MTDAVSESQAGYHAVIEYEYEQECPPYSAFEFSRALVGWRPGLVARNAYVVGGRLRATPNRRSSANIGGT